MKNARYTPTQSTLLLRLFFRGYMAGDTAAATSVPKPTITRFFEHVRTRIFSDARFTRSFINALFLVNFGGAIHLLRRVVAIEARQLFDCAYSCSKGSPPKRIRDQIASLPDRHSQAGAVPELTRKRLACTYCPLKLFEYTPEELFQPHPPCSEEALAKLHYDMCRPLESVAPADYEYFMKKFPAVVATEGPPEAKYFGIVLNWEVDAASQAWLFEKLRMKSEPSEAMETWVRVLCHLGNYRRVTVDNIVEFVIGGLVFRAIQCRDLRLPRKLSIPHAIQVAPGLGDLHPDSTVHFQNDIEGFILASALRILEENPF